MSVNGVLDRQLDMMDASPPILEGEVDFNFVNPPEVLASRMADIWWYDAITEIRTGGPGGFAAQIETYIPSAKDPDSDFGKYLRRWLGHELPHGKIVVEALKRIGRDEPTDLPEKVPPSIVFLGRISETFKWFEDIAEGVVATQGARNEKMTLDHYRIEQHILEDLGERGFAETAIRRVIKQEAIHLAWNRAKLRQIVDQRSALQLRVISALDKAIWRPVGAKSKQFRGDLSRATASLALGHGNELALMARGVQNVVDETLATGLPKRRSQEFVLRRILAIIPDIHTFAD